MVARRHCHYCGQPLPERRMGIRMTPIEGRVFDLIQRSGDDGILADDLFSVIFKDDVDYASLKVHVSNLKLKMEAEDCGYAIKSYGKVSNRKGRGFYRLERVS